MKCTETDYLYIENCCPLYIYIQVIGPGHAAIHLISFSVSIVHTYAIIHNTSHINHTHHTSFWHWMRITTPVGGNKIINRLACSVYCVGHSFLAHFKISESVIGSMGILLSIIWHSIILPEFGYFGGAKFWLFYHCSNKLSFVRIFVMNLVYHWHFHQKVCVFRRFIGGAH